MIIDYLNTSYFTVQYLLYCNIYWKKILFHKTIITIICIITELVKIVPSKMYRSVSLVLSNILCYGKTSFPSDFEGKNYP